MEEKLAVKSDAGGDYFAWTWEKEGSSAVFKDCDRSVQFNPGFSVGTVAVRGAAPLEKGCHHYFEILMSSDVYGTDMMIGIGTDGVNLRKYSHSFISMLGYDDESWGLSYSGHVQHGGVLTNYAKPFGQGTLVGVHVDLFTGTMEFYLNRKPLGPAFRNIPTSKPIYPMISSTAARSGMTLKCSRSFKHSLQLQCVLALGRSTFWPENVSIFKCHDLPHGLKKWAENNYWWVTCKAVVAKEAPGPAAKEASITPEVLVPKDGKKAHGVRRKKAGSSEEKEVPPSSENKRLRLRSQRSTDSV